MHHKRKSAMAKRKRLSSKQKEKLRRAAVREFEKRLDRDTKLYKEMLLREFRKR
jgi:hypothetical protein